MRCLIGVVALLLLLIAVAVVCTGPPESYTQMEMCMECSACSSVVQTAFTNVNNYEHRSAWTPPPTIHETESVRCGAATVRESINPATAWRPTVRSGRFTGANA